MSAAGKASDRALMALVIDALRAWSGDAPPTRLTLARAMNRPNLAVGQAVDALRMRGMVQWDVLALAPSMMVSNENEVKASSGDLAAAHGGGSAAAAATVEPQKPFPAARDDSGSGPQPASATEGSKVRSDSSGLSRSQANAAGPEMPVKAGVGAMTTPAAEILPVVGRMDAVADAIGRMDMMTGAELAAVLRERARLADVALLDFVAPLWAHPPTGLNNLRAARRPIAATVARIAAFLAGEPLPPPRKVAVRVAQARHARGVAVAGSAEVPASPALPTTTPTLAQQIKADAAAAQRKAATMSSLSAVKLSHGERGPEQFVGDAWVLPPSHSGGASGRAANELTLGGRMQMMRLGDGPGAGIAVLREAWPDALRRLEALAVRSGERPIPCLVRLIHDAADEAGVRLRRELIDPDDNVHEQERH